MKLLPPVLQGPLYETSTELYVETVISGANITVYAGEDTIYSGTVPLFNWVTLEKPIQIGDQITAKITLGSDESPRSAPVEVIVQPSDLPAPEFVSVINNCSTLLAMNRLVIGATLEITKPETNEIVAKERVSRTYQIIRLDPTIPIDNTGHLSAKQTVGANSSAVRNSLPIVDISPLINQEDLSIPQPGVLSFSQLSACRTDLVVLGIPGLEISIQNEGYVTNYLITETPEQWIDDCQPLKEGTLKVIQLLERLPSGYKYRKEDLNSESAEYTVGPATPPGPGRLLAPYCPQFENILASELSPGAEIEVHARVEPDTNWTLIGTGMVHSAQQDIHVPFSMFREAGFDHDLQLEVAIRQSKCGATGSFSESVGLGPFSLPQTPSLYSPIASCSSFLVLREATAGTRIDLVDQQQVNLLKKPYYATDGYNIIPLNRPLKEGESVSGTCHYCAGSLSIARQPVVAIQQAGTNLRPIKPGDPLVFEKCVIGSRIDVYVTYFNRYAAQNEASFLFHFYPAYETTSVPLLRGTKLGEQYSFVVSLCDRPLAKGSVEVKKGKLKVWVEPSRIDAGKHQSITIYSQDEFSGSPVTSDVLFSDGTTIAHGTIGPITFFVPNERTSPYTGIVRPIAGLIDLYEEGSFSVQVRSLADQQPQNPPRVFAQFTLNTDFNIYLGNYTLTVNGSYIPAGATCELFEIHQELISDGINKRHEQKTYHRGSAQAAQDGTFTISSSFDLPLTDPETRMHINDGVMAVVKIRAGNNNMEFNRNMSQNSSAFMDRVI